MTSLDFIPAISCLQSYKAFFQLPELSCKGLQSNTRLFIKKKRRNRGFPSVKTFQIPAEPCPQPSRTFVQTFRNFLMSKLPNPFRNPLPAMQRLPKHCRTFQNLRTPCKILQTASNLQLPQTSASGTPRTSAQTFQLPEPSSTYAKNPKTYCRFLTTFLESSQNLDAWNRNVMVTEGTERRTHQAGVFHLWPLAGEQNVRWEWRYKLPPTAVSMPSVNDMAI